MNEVSERLHGLRAKLEAGEEADRVTVRTFLGWFGVQRRGYYKVRAIRKALSRAGLVTDPDFEGAYIDSEISFRTKPVTGKVDILLPSVGLGGTAEAPSSEPPDQMGLPSTVVFIGGSVPDPTYRIGKLAAANSPPLGVSPDSPLEEAVTLMLQYDYSQLPVMQSERTVKGAISWQSIGTRLALGRRGTSAREFLEDPTIVSSDASLFDVIPRIVEQEYVLVRDGENRISGIVTTSDLSSQFRQLAEPFLLLGEIENHIRRLIDGRFTADEIRSACDPNDDDREVESVADLSLGEYLRLLEKPELWAKLDLPLSRIVFLKQLDDVRRVRNDVMHFDPDPVGEQELALLRHCVQFLQGLQRIGVAKHVSVVT